MAKRKVYHVVPGKAGGRDVKREGSKRSSAHYDKKADAVGRGKALAKSGRLGLLKIHKQDGTFQKEYTYGKDPYPPKDRKKGTNHTGPRKK